MLTFAPSCLVYGPTLEDEEYKTILSWDARLKEKNLTMHHGYTITGRHLSSRIVPVLISWAIWVCLLPLAKPSSIDNLFLLAQTPHRAWSTLTWTVPVMYFDWSHRSHAINEPTSNAVPLLNNCCFHTCSPPLVATDFCCIGPSINPL